MKRLALLIVMVVLASKVSIASNSINFHRFDFSNTLETLTVEDALGADSEMARRKFLLRLSYDYTQNPTTGKDHNGSTIYGSIEDIHTYMLGFGAMVSKRFFLAANIPVHRTEVNAGGNRSTNLGDISVQGKYRLFSKKGLNFGLVPFLTFATGSDTQGTTDGGLGYGLKLAADKALGKFKFFFNLGYRHNDNMKAMGYDRTDLALGAFGIFFKVNKMLGFNAEYNREYALNGGPLRNSQRVTLAARITVKNAHFFLGSGIESMRGFSDQDFSVYAGVKFGLGKTKCDKKKSCSKKKACCKKKVCPKTGKTCPKKAPAKVEELKKDLSIERSIKFRTGSSKIKTSSYADLDSAAAAIVEAQDLIEVVNIAGHTDSQGRAVNNKRLSQKRADAVKAYLVSKGVKAEKISAVGYGEEALKVSPERNAADREANRRVEFSVTAK